MTTAPPRPTVPMVWVHAALAVVSLTYGANYVLAKEVMPAYIAPFALIVVRAVCAAALFWLLAAFGPRERIRSARDYRRLAVCAFFGVAANQLLFFWGLSLTTPVHASLIMTTTPVLVLVVSAIVLGERITRRKGLGVLLGATGAILLVAGERFTFAGSTSVGDALVVANSLSYGIYLVLVKPLMARYHPLTVIRWVFTFGAVMVLPFGTAQLFDVAWAELPPRAVAIVAFIVLGVTFLAYLLNAWALRHVRASVVGIFIYLQPLFATLIAVGLGREALTTHKVVLGLVIFVGVGLVSRR